MAHGYLLEMGYTHTHVEAEWEDIGGPESGPCLDGHDEYDVYESDVDHVYICNGEAYFEKRDLVMEAYLEGLGQ